MEKLQAALARARSQRSDTAQIHPGPKAKPEAPGAWDDLPRVHLSDATLRKHRVVSQAPDTSSASFDVLRTKTLLQMQQNGWSRLAITSPESSSGKTTIACNLALGLGRTNNLRTILFDFDLGDPSVHQFLGLESRHSLRSILNGRVPLSDHLQRVRENVGVVISPEPEADPNKLILSDKIGEFLDSVQDTYKPDVMIFDLPAILGGDRARAFLKNTDCALIVALAEKTRFNQLDVCEREVAESTNVLGVVLNGCHPSAVKAE
ncbi:CpsD/CapB family tyrosine-protein kinase [uncultured Tateyamaria sp.]|uniref:CpsD/CapB family tyrosine-protein kinase n=1 Tax=uncultured Tateyamaria sp. TaxID=455651 RepID=UPI002614A961|nr:CpsD/CapB family tyrosine-protein kinase [uncultured Tateyamaria sp.]